MITSYVSTATDTLASEIEFPVRCTSRGSTLLTWQAAFDLFTYALAFAPGNILISSAAYIARSGLPTHLLQNCLHYRISRSHRRNVRIRLPASTL